jgi:hypothetical protein
MMSHGQSTFRADCERGLDLVKIGAGERVRGSANPPFK